MSATSDAPRSAVSRVVDWAAHNWGSKTTLATVMLAATAIAVWAVAKDPDAAGRATWGMVAAAPSAVVLIWLLTNRVPRAPKHFIGIVVALAAESDDQDRQLQADLLAELRELLLADQVRTRFVLLEYGKRLSGRIRDQKDARYFRTKSRAALFIWGRARARKLPSGQVHILNIQGLVSHAATTEHNKALLSTEFGEFMPRKWIIGKANEVFEFEVTSGWLNVAARYVVGIAALLSGDLRYCETLLRSVEASMNQHSALPRQMRDLGRRLPGRFANLYSIWLNAIITKYIRTRDRQVVMEGEVIADKLLALAPRDESALLFKATCSFVLRRDLAEARTALGQCKQSSFGVWRYSEAFLLAYEGKLDKSAVAYRRAFRSRMPDDTIPVQVEEFIQLVLDEEPDRIGLHYALGLVNLEAKGDYDAAVTELARFVSASAGRYPVQEREAMALIGEAEQLARQVS